MAKKTPQLSKEELFAQLREHFSEIGKKGGSAKTPKKQAAARKNAKKYKTDAQRKAARAATQARYQEKRKKEIVDKTKDG